MNTKLNIFTTILYALLPLSIYAEVDALTLASSINNITGYPEGISFYMKDKNLNISVANTHSLSANSSRITLSKYSSKDQVLVDLDSGKLKSLISKNYHNITAINFKGDGISNSTQCLPKGHSGSTLCVTITENYCGKLKEILGDNPFKELSKCRDLFGDLGGVFTSDSEIGKELLSVEKQNLAILKKHGAETVSTYGIIEKHFKDLSKSTKNFSSNTTKESDSAWGYFLESLRVCSRPIKFPTPESKPVPVESHHGTSVTAK